MRSPYRRRTMLTLEQQKQLREIPPWWANPIVFVPGSGALAVLIACALIAWSRLNG